MSAMFTCTINRESEGINRHVEIQDPRSEMRVIHSQILSLW